MINTGLDGFVEGREKSSEIIRKHSSYILQLHVSLLCALRTETWKYLKFAVHILKITVF